MPENRVSGLIVEAAYRIHSWTGPGLLESAYEAMLLYELESCGLRVARQEPRALVYRGVALKAYYRIDLLVEDLVIVEVKSVERLLPVHKKQLLTYLRLTGLRLGLVVNFDGVLIKTGIARVVNGLPE